jgi:hypothetical protein
MFERLRFLRYAWRFERAFKTDEWDGVKDCFHPEGTYTIVGAPPYDGVTKGPEAIARNFKRLLDEFDRKFEKRRPGLASWLRVKGGRLTFKWRARYTAPFGSALVTGVSECRFSRGKIIELRDTMVPEEWAPALALVKSLAPPS